MSVTLNTWGSTLAFRSAEAASKASATEAAEVLRRDARFDHRLDLPSDCTWRELFAGFHQFLFTTTTPGVLSSWGYDDVFHRVDELWETIAPLLVDGSYYAYDVDFKEITALAVANGYCTSLTLTPEEKDELRARRGGVYGLDGRFSPQRPRDLVEVMARRGVTLLDATVVLPQEYHALGELNSYASRGKLLRTYEKQY